MSNSHKTMCMRIHLAFRISKDDSMKKKRLIGAAAELFYFVVGVMGISIVMAKKAFIEQYSHH